MQIYSSRDVLPWNAELICRQSRLVALAAVFVYGGLIAGIPFALWYRGSMPTWLAMIIGAIGALCLPMVVGSFLDSIRRSNWLIVLGREGVWINLRSYRNHRFEDAQTVVHLLYGELASAARHTAKLSAPSSDGTTTWKVTSLDLNVQVPNTDLVREAIAAERRRKTTRKHLGGLVTVSGRSNHVPVTMPADNLVRITWKSRHDFVRPRIDRVLQSLTNRIAVVGDSAPAKTANWEELADDELDDLVLQFVESGDTISAIKLLTRRRHFTITQAKQFVDGLTERL